MAEAKKDNSDTSVVEGAVKHTGDGTIKFFSPETGQVVEASTHAEAEKQLKRDKEGKQGGKG